MAIVLVWFWGGSTKYGVLWPLLTFPHLSKVELKLLKICEWYISDTIMKTQSTCVEKNLMTFTWLHRLEIQKQINFYWFFCQIINNKWQKTNIEIIHITFKYFWCHPGSTALVVGHVSVCITGCSKITDLQNSSTTDQQQAEIIQQHHHCQLSNAQYTTVNN